MSGGSDVALSEIHPGSIVVDLNGLLGDRVVRVYDDAVVTARARGRGPPDRGLLPRIRHTRGAAAA